MRRHIDIPLERHIITLLREKVPCDPQHGSAAALSRLPGLGFVFNFMK